MFKILALDQSTRITGWSIITEKGIKSHGKLVVSDTNAPIQERFEEMFNLISELIDKTKPAFVVFEGTQYQNNAGAFGSLSKLQGLIMALLFLRNIGYFIVEPTCWKSYCHIEGRRREQQKSNTKKFVAEKYGLIVSEDEADAIGIATWAINNIKSEK
jgi:Holliday junction resolvasome RuvABC endonuclease subunit